MSFARTMKVAVTFVFLSLVLLPATRAEDTPKEKLPKITKQRRLELIRSLAAERVYARKYFPIGKKSLTMKPDGTVVPEGTELQMLLTKFGQAAKPGDRVRITDLKIKGRKIIFEINGGPEKKKKWYERIEIGATGGSTAPLDRGEDKEGSRGSALTIEFKDYVPNITVDQLKELLKPVLDFTSISPVEAYLSVIPEIAKEAIKNHEVLVGMDGEMVRHAKNRPPRKIREKDDSGNNYEEWIYGTPPEDVLFVRLVKDRVTQVKTMKITGEKTVKTDRVPEIDDYFAKHGVAVAEQKQQQQQQAAPPAKAPTLRRPGETREDSSQPPDTQPQTRPE